MMNKQDINYKRATKFSNGTEYEVFRYNYCDNGCIFHKTKENGFPEFMENGGCPIEDGLEGGRFDASLYPNVLVSVWDGEECINWNHCPFFTREEAGNDSTGSD